MYSARRCPQDASSLYGVGVRRSFSDGGSHGAPAVWLGARGTYLICPMLYTEIPHFFAASGAEIYSSILLSSRKNSFAIIIYGQPNRSNKINMNYLSQQWELYRRILEKVGTIQYNRVNNYG